MDNKKIPIKDFDNKSKHYRKFKESIIIDVSLANELGIYSLTMQTVTDGVKTFFFNKRIGLMKLRKLIYLKVNNFELDKYQLHYINTFMRYSFNDGTIDMTSVKEAIKKIDMRRQIVRLTCKRRKLKWV